MFQAFIFTFVTVTILVPINTIADHFVGSTCPKTSTIVKVSVDVIELKFGKFVVGNGGVSAHMSQLSLAIKMYWKNTDGDDKDWLPHVYYPGGKHITNEMVYGTTEKVLWKKQDGETYMSYLLAINTPFVINVIPGMKEVIFTIPIESFGCSTDKLKLEWDDKDEPVKIVERPGHRKSTVRVDGLIKQNINITQGSEEIPIRGFGGALGKVSHLYSEITVSEITPVAAAE